MGEKDPRPRRIRTWASIFATIIETTSFGMVAMGLWEAPGPLGRVGVCIGRRPRIGTRTGFSLVLETCCRDVLVPVSRWCSRLVAGTCSCHVPAYTCVDLCQAHVAHRALCLLHRSMLRKRTGLFTSSTFLGCSQLREPPKQDSRGSNVLAHA